MRDEGNDWVRVALAIGWGFAVLYAFFAVIVVLVSALEGDFGTAGIAAAIAATFALLAHGARTILGRQNRVRRAKTGRPKPLAFQAIGRKAVLVGAAAIVTGVVVIGAKQISVVAEKGVVGWLTADATTLGELITVTVLLLVLLALLVWPLWVLGSRIYWWAWETRLRRSARRADAGRAST